jgi:glutathione peroxidase
MHPLLGALLLLCLTTTTAASSSPPPHSLTPSLPHSIFDFQARDLSGATLPLSSLRGKRAFLVVNVASQCGLTDNNYEELQVLHAKYSEHLEILAFPCE